MTYDSYQRFPLQSVLLCAAAEIAVFGWRPSGHTMDPNGRVVKKDPNAPPSTKERVVQHFAGDEATRAAMRRDIVAGAKAKNIDLFSDTLQQLVADATKWAQQIPEGTTDTAMWAHRIRRLAEQTMVELRDFGFAVSIISAFVKTQLVTSPSVHLGMVGDPLVVTLFVSHVTAVAGFQQPSSVPTDRMLVVGTQEGTDNVVSFYTKLDPAVTPGSKLVVKGKVYKHTVKQGVRVTQLHYVKWETA